MNGPHRNVKIPRPFRTGERFGARRPIATGERRPIVATATVLTGSAEPANRIGLDDTYRHVRRAAVPTPLEVRPRWPRAAYRHGDLRTSGGFFRSPRLCVAREGNTTDQPRPYRVACVTASQHRIRNRCAGAKGQAV